MSLPASGLLTHDGVDVWGHCCIAFLVSTDQNCTIYMQGSDDNVNWYDFKSATDSDRSWNCNNEKIWVPINICAHYVRLVVYNAAASTATVTGVITAMI
ncbi:MAG: hypothetical protein ACXQTW_00270 [Candidatus Methanospirareceae archaeon]